MRISTQDWINYIDKLTELCETAGNQMKDYVAHNGFSDTEAIIDYAYALVTKYGSGTGALAAAMYDAIAEMQGKIIPPAEVAPTAEYGDVARVVNGTIKKSRNPNSLSGTVNRLVKKSSTDTMLFNAARDGAEYAWVPMGDTCAFCITLASRGWLSISKEKLRNHKDHLHSNCDCTYAVRFDGKSGVEGYNPDEYLEIYNNADGTNSQDKINSIRRMQYAANPEKYRAQKRAAYAERNLLRTKLSFDTINSEKTDERNRKYNMHTEKYGDSAIWIDEKHINSESYRNKFLGISGSKEVDDILAEDAITILKDRSGSQKETLILIDKETGDEILTIIENNEDSRIVYTPEHESIIKQAIGEGKKIIAMHNHPTGWPPTADDCSTALDKGYEIGITCGHNGNVYVYYPSEVLYNVSECDMIHNIIADESMYEKDINKVLDTWKRVLSEYGMIIRERK